MLPGPDVPEWFNTAVLCTALASMLVLTALIKITRLKPASLRKGADINRLSGKEFEAWLAERFREKGYRAEQVSMSADYGVDLLVQKKGFGRHPVIAVQAKRYSGNVGIAAVQQVEAGMRYYGADAAMVITNSRFTKPAENLAEACGVMLLDGDGIKTAFCSKRKLRLV